MRSDESIDRPAYEALIDRTLDGGVGGVTPGSTTGEGPYLTREERKKLLEWTIDHVAGRIPVVASVAATSTREGIHLAQHAETAGATAVLASIQQFFPLSRDEVITHFATLAQNTELPVILYNQPLAGIDLTPDMIAEVASEQPNVLGVKEASGDVSRITDIAHLAPDNFTIYCGHGAYSLPSFLLGAQGWFTALANVAPAACTALYHAARAKQWDEARSAYERLSPLTKLIYGRQLAANVKVALELLGYPAGPVRAPMTGPTEREYRQLKECLAHIRTV